MTVDESLAQARLLLQNLVHYPSMHGRPLAHLTGDIQRVADALRSAWQGGIDEAEFLKEQQR